MQVVLGPFRKTKTPTEELKVLEVLSKAPFVSIEHCLWNGQEVLAKRLREDMMKDSHVLPRFDREGEVLERLDHPNIAKFVYRRPGLLLREYIQGRTLYYHLEQKDLDRTRSLQIAHSILAAIAHAHQRDIIHLDLKPGNILIDQTGKVRLIDFGCAKDLTLESITHVDARLGTPHYMAPEQFMGTRNNFRSDLYSIAAIVFEMLMRQRPFGDDPFTWLLGRAEPPAKWPEPPALADVLRRALERKPENRFESALEMLAALEAAVPELKSLTK